MRNSIARHWMTPGMLCLALLVVPALFTNCSGGSKGDSSSDSANLFNNRNVNLYLEVPAIQIQGNIDTSVTPNKIRDFNPQTSKESGFNDLDGDGILDEQINDFDSFGNAANNMLDIDAAACVTPAGGGNKNTGYVSPDVWVDSTEFPDTMPATAAGTNGTQFIQLIVPFPISRDSIFQDGVQELSWLNPDDIDSALVDRERAIFLE